MKKEEFIKRYGKVAYEKWLQQSREWHARDRKEHREELNVRSKVWRKANPEKVKAAHAEINRKGGKYYEYAREYITTGLQHERYLVRKMANYQYRAIKQATKNSAFHHEWIPGTAKYRGLALVEAEAHRYGIIKVIKILEGKITLFTEKEIAEQEGN